ncbi:MAG: phosphodiester glycosidase family protein [Planctomycetota bacterium]|nr:phosphodiester glycosidase family protein [Planctomycetota bacterium]
MRRVTILLVILLIAASAQAQQPPTHPFPGVTYQHEIRATPPLHLHIVTISLKSPAIHIQVSRGGNDPHLTPPWETTLMPVSAMAARDRLNIAINANFFAPKDYQMILGRRVGYYPGNWARACGFSMSDGRLYSKTPMLADWPTLVVNSQGHVTIGKRPHLPPDARQIVSGNQMILINGQIAIPDDPDPSSNGRPAPHTAVAINQDATMLILMVVDGRRPEYSAGLTIHQVARELQKRGAWQALNLDSGGSSTLVMTDPAGQPQVINRPSDGHDLPIPLSVERSVVNALGIIIDGAATQPTTQPSLQKTFDTNRN